MFATAGLDKKIILWDMQKLLVKRVYQNYHTKAITILDFNAQLILLVSGGLDQKIYVWNPYINQPIHCFESPSGSVLDLRFIPKSSFLVALYEKGLV
jgi:WD40 repeat protein